MRFERVANQMGMALLGALAAVTAGGVIGASMVAYYQAFVLQSRGAYVRSAMTNLDNKIRYMAMQPYAYACGKENGQGEIEGVGSCRLNVRYFKDLDVDAGSAPDYEVRIPMPGARCPSGVATCGFKLDLNPAKNYGFKSVAGQGKFSYHLSYEGLETQLNPGGYGSPASPDSGMNIPVEVLQSQAFDCKLADPNRPAFNGFVNGRPLCTGFAPCAPGQVVTAVNFQTMQLTCTPLAAAPGKTIDCRGGIQRMIGRINWHDGLLDRDPAQACGELPVPALTGTPISRITCEGGGELQPNGSCFYANRWCQVTSIDPNSAPVGFTMGPGSRDVAGCVADGVRTPSGGTRAYGTMFLKCIVGAYATYPVADSMCAPSRTPSSTCPTGQVRQPDGTCAASGTLTWQLRTMGGYRTKYGQSRYVNTSTGELCTSGYEGYLARLPDSFGIMYMSPAAGNSAECPALNGAWNMGENDSYNANGLPCTTENLRCHWTEHNKGRKVTDTGRSYTAPDATYYADYFQNCAYYVCTNDTVCPNGSPKVNGICAGQAGVLHPIPLPPPSDVAQLPMCPPDATGTNVCPAVGAKCKWFDTLVNECRPSGTP